MKNDRHTLRLAYCTPDRKGVTYHKLITVQGLDDDDDDLAQFLSRRNAAAKAAFCRSYKFKFVY